MSGPDVHPDDMPHDPLDVFLDDVRSAVADTPAPGIGAELATLFRDGAAPVVTTAPHRGRRWSVRGVVAGAVAGMTFGGLGIAGALPGPVQHGVASVVHHVGVQLPDPETTTTTVAPTTTSVPGSSSTTAVPRRSSDDTPTTVERGDDHTNGNGGNSENHGRSGDHDSTTTTPSNEHGNGEGKGSSEEHGGRIPTSTTLVRSDDGSQAAGHHANSGGQSE